MNIRDMDNEDGNGGRPKVGSTNYRIVDEALVFLYMWYTTSR